MANPDHSAQSRPTHKTGLLARLSTPDRSVWVVVAACLILIALAVWDRIDAGAATLAALVLIGLAWWLPQGRQGRVAVNSQTALDSAREDLIVETIADAMQAPTMVLDRKSMVAYRNSAATQAFPQTSIGAPLTNALRQPVLLQALTRARRDMEPQVIELQQVSPGPVWYAVSISPFSLPDLAADEGQRYLVTFTNLTEQRRTETMRVDFVANASHELRTPLTSVIGFIDTLLGPAAEDPEARKRFLGIMRTQAERMSNLIEDLMSLSRIEMRQHVRPTGSTDLSNLLKTVVEGLHTQISEAGVEMDVQIRTDETRIAGDQDELYEVFENLLDNAIKYGGSGGKIAIMLAPVEDRPGFAFQVTVQDFGQGIEPEHVPRLTERFYRVDAESSRKKKGTGLGLAIVKHIVSRHRGQLLIRSALGEGMRVDVLLPR